MGKTRATRHKPGKTTPKISSPRSARAAQWQQLPTTFAPADLLGLQRTLGNRRVSRLLLQRQTADAAAGPASALFRDNATLREVAAGSRNLSNGDEGTAVSRVQRALILAGHSLDPHGADGDFGGTTETAVRAYQDSRDDLENTGVVDAATLHALDGLPSTRSAPVGLRAVHMPARSSGRAFMLDWDAQHRNINQDDTLREAFNRHLATELARFFGEELTVEQVVARIEQAERDGRDAEALIMRQNLSKANQFAVVQTLDVEHSGRYRRNPNATYCNIYAYDVVTALGGYLPRVWWTDSAIRRLERGEDVPVRYGRTVHEMNANALTAWMRRYGGDFGWRQAADVNEAQEETNRGKLVILLAANARATRSGHVNIVMPEVGESTALRGEDGAVQIPMQSQAGAGNFQYRRSRSRWWANANHRNGAAWIFEGRPDSPLIPPERMGRRSDMRRAEVDVHLDVTDSEILRDEHQSFDVRRQVNLVPGAAARQVHVRRCVGGEVVVDLTLGLTLADDRAINGAVEALLYEGTSCSTRDLEARYAETVRVADGSQEETRFEMVNRETFGGDRAEVQLTVRSRN